MIFEGIAARARSGTAAAANATEFDDLSLVFARYDAEAISRAENLNRDALFLGNRRKKANASRGRSFPSAIDLQALSFRAAAPRSAEPIARFSCI
uniref:Uncharacterized protein n=1 Tax=Acidicaldus sp. TaxID=1872105 RepID=A0A8J4H8V0_9PROT